MRYPLPAPAARVLATLLVTLVAASARSADPAAFVAPPDALVLERVPGVPVSIAEATARYGESRPAGFDGFNPARREVLIGTRFADTTQVHLVSQPLGARRQVTFFADRVLRAAFLPGGRSILVQKDVGGGEWFQIYRQDLDSGAVTLLTDGKSRNGDFVIAHGDPRIAYSSTRRNGRDTDIWVTDARDGSSRLVLECAGGGWQALAWSPDNRRLLVSEFRSVTDSSLWLVDVADGSKRRLTPAAPETASYTGGAFSADGRAVYVLSDRGSEVHRPVRLDLASGAQTPLAPTVSAEVDNLAVSDDGRHIAFTANEDGYSRVYVHDPARGAPRAVRGVPPGVVADLAFDARAGELGFSVASAHAPQDVYSVELASGRVVRWTEGETGGLNPETFAEPRLVRWTSFDGLSISGYLYAPDPRRFPGPRPVIIDIHGGPEAQFRPGYLGQKNYYVSELGVAILEPNVRGSAGQGKTFLSLDNATLRDHAYKDVAAALDWIATQPSLDAGRVLVTGGSYGGHMTWATAAFYNDRIRCAMPIVGMSSLVTFLEHTEAYRRDLRRVEYGDERDPATRSYLEQIAPLNHLDAMHKPVFAIVGRNDPRVPWTESRQIIDRLAAEGTPTWFMVANDEGHGYAKKRNRDYLFNAQVMFVDRCLLSREPFTP